MTIAPLMAWVAFITLQFVLSRIPILPNPNTDVAGLGAALTLSLIVDASETAAVGMLVAVTGL